MKIINQVYETKDYEKFVFLSNNREVSINVRLEASIRERGIIVPVIVNEKFEIADGQHRVVMAKKLNITVPFIVIQGIGSREMKEMNNTGKVWSVEDYVKSYADEGHSEYVKLLELVELDIMPITKLISLATNSTDGSRPTQNAKKGEFEFFNYDLFLDFLDVFEKLSDEFPGEMSSGFADALYKLYRLKKFDHKRILNRVGKLAIETKGVLRQGVIMEKMLSVYHTSLRSDSAITIDWKTESNGNIILLEELKDEFKYREVK